MAWWNSSKSRNRRRTRPKAGDGVNLSALAVSEMGPEILRWIRNSTVNGLMGRFQLRTKSNVSNFTKKENGCRTSKDNLMPPIWPGGTRQQPKGWVIPTVTGKKMKIGVPVTQRFSEFFKIVWDPQTDVPTYSGFSYDVFLEVLKELPFALPYEFKPFMNASRQSAGSYDDLLYQITLGVVDAVVADMTIIANRSNYRLQPKFVDVHDLVRNRHYVGYQSSFVKELLIREMNFDESRLRSYSSPEKYHKALMKGSGNGGVDAIFDETPYLKLFLAKYCDKYTIIGPTYKTDGFAFVSSTSLSLCSMHYYL
ncbi:hypothetical protein CRG98_015985 [Punica granatum]|uniref:Ionotropic glutamate receptor C-terminal domain-containing protein n=1 Tax=Punica granatum TaxID=22663 RepID=A0A2I0K4Y5_PUNGR|nr:hypothetical protein CRG98_015985 [Punica granatum]